MALTMFSTVALVKVRGLASDAPDEL